MQSLYRNHHSLRVSCTSGITSHSKDGLWTFGCFVLADEKISPCYDCRRVEGTYRQEGEEKSAQTGYLEV